MHLPVLCVFGDGTPQLSMSRLSRYAVLEHLFLLSLHVMIKMSLHPFPYK